MKKKEQDKNNHILYIVIIALIYLCDQLSKYYIIKWVKAGESIPVLPGLFNVTFVRNSGTVFGFLQDYTFIFIIFSILAVVVLYVFYLKFSRYNNLLFIATALVTGGALGNLSDRIRWGYVIDFLHFHYRQWHWPSFNCADIVITMGIILILFSMLTMKED